MGRRRRAGRTARYLPRVLLPSYSTALVFYCRPGSDDTRWPNGQLAVAVQVQGGGDGTAAGNGYSVFVAKVGMGTAARGGNNHNSVGRAEKPCGNDCVSAVTA